MKYIVAAGGIAFFALLVYGKIKLASAPAVGGLLLLGAIVFATSTTAQAE